MSQVNTWAEQDAAFERKMARKRAERAKYVQEYRENPRAPRCVPVNEFYGTYAVTTACKRRDVVAIIQLHEYDADALQSLYTEDDNGNAAMRLAELHGWQDVVAERPSSLTGETRVTLERVFLS